MRTTCDVDIVINTEYIFYIRFITYGIWQIFNTFYLQYPTIWQPFIACLIDHSFVRCLGQVCYHAITIVGLEDAVWHISLYRHTVQKITVLLSGRYGCNRHWTCVLQVVARPKTTPVSMVKYTMPVIFSLQCHGCCGMPFSHQTMPFTNTHCVCSCLYCAWVSEILNVHQSFVCFHNIYFRNQISWCELDPVQILLGYGQHVFITWTWYDPAAGLRWEKIDKHNHDNSAQSSS